MCEWAWLVNCIAADVALFFRAMETGSQYHNRDGLLLPKRLQDQCIELLSWLIVESVHRIVREEDSLVQLYEQEEEDQSQLLNLLKGKGPGKATGPVVPDHFQAEDEERELLRHLRSYIGIDGVLGAEQTLPGHFCDQILDHLSSKLLLSDQLVGVVCHRTFGCITKFPSYTIKPHPLKLNTLRLLAQQPLVELSLDLDTSQQSHCIRGHEIISWRDLSTILGNSSLCFTLRSLSLSHVRILEPEWLSRLQCLIRLHFSNLTLPYKTPISDLNKLPHLTVFSVTNSNLSVVPCGNVNTLRQLTLSNAPLHANAHMLADILSLRNLVSVDVARTSLGDDRDYLRTPLQQTDWVMRLSQLPLLKYLDVSRHLVTVNDMGNFDAPHHRMSFLGLLSTQACMRRNINSDAVSAVLCTYGSVADTCAGVIQWGML